MEVHHRSGTHGSAGVTPSIRFEALDSWRGLAALSVVMFHAQIVSHIHDFPIVRAGEALVDFFFVLSGFVIAHAYVDRIRTGQEAGRFLFLRLGRIYPLHVFMLALFLAFETAKAWLPGLTNPADPAFSEANEPATLVSNLLLMHSARPDGLLTWNTPSWSISAEFIAYLLFAAAVLTARRHLVLLCCIAIVLAPAILSLVAPHGMQSTADFGAVRALFGFAAGVLVYRIARPGLIESRREDGTSTTGPASLRWTVAELLVVAIAAGLLVATPETALAYAMPAVYCLVIVVFAIERGWLSRLMKLRPLLFLGAISYSLYMTHMFVLLRTTNVARLADKLLGTEWVTQVGRTARYGGGIDMGNPWLGDLVMLAVVAVTVALSWLTWRYVELPGQELSRRLAPRLFGARRPAARQEKGPLGATL